MDKTDDRPVDSFSFLNQIGLYSICFTLPPDIGTKFYTTAEQISLFLF